MKSDSLNYIPSFDSIPYLGRDLHIFPNEMKLIVSKHQILSIKSLEDQMPRNQRSSQEYQYSIDQHPELNSMQQDKEIPMGTIESFRTPKKKRKTGCVCKKTGCLKLYCQCFSSGKICSQECSCCNCLNISQNNEEVESVRAIRKHRSKNTQEKKSCNCKKSQCQKKYCECFNAKMPCSSSCKCQGCANTDHHHNT